MQTIRQVFGFFLLLLSAAWWLSDPTDAASLTHVFAWRAVLLQYTGVLAIGVMALRCLGGRRCLGWIGVTHIHLEYAHAGP